MYSNNIQWMKKLALFLFSTVLISACKPAPKVTLSLNLQQGQHIQFDLNSTQSITQQQPGNTIKIDQHIGYKVDMTVMQVHDSEYIVKWQYTHLLFEQKTDNGKIKYDSEDNTAEVPEMILPYQRMLNIPVYARLNRSGKMTSIENRDSLLAYISNQVDSTNTKALKDSLSKYVQSNENTNQIQNSWNIYPTKAISRGDVWEKRLTTEGSIPMMIENKFTIKSFRDSMARIELQGVLRSDPNTAQLKGMHYDISGTQEGYIKLDMKTGLIRREEITQYFSGKIFRTGVGETMQIPVEVYSRSVFSIVE